MGEVFFLNFHQYDTYAETYIKSITKRHWKTAKDFERALLNLDKELAKVGEP
jgi:hypothetical protein